MRSCEFWGALLCVHIGTFWPVRMSAAFPGPSDNLRTHDVLSDSLRLTWNAPASAVPVLGYQVSAQAGGTSGFSVVVVDTGSAATQAHVTGLHPGCWCASLRAHPHAPARAPQVPGANWAAMPRPNSIATAVHFLRTGTSSAWPRGPKAGSAR